jgi:hypothetical protein
MYTNSITATADAERAGAELLAEIEAEEVTVIDLLKQLYCLMRLR